MTVLSMSLIAVIPILLIIVLRALALNKLPKKLFVALWGLVLIRTSDPFYDSNKFKNGSGDSSDFECN